MGVAEAEAHARETRIELSLERVRARSMAMHSSAELVEASDVLFQQLQTLGIESIRTGVGIFDGPKETMEIWSRSHSEKQSGEKILGMVPKDTHPFFVGCFNAWKNNEKFFSYDFAGNEVEQYNRTMGSILSSPESTTYNPREVFYSFFFSEGSLNVIRHTPLREEELLLLQRFANVSGVMYRRFLDLQTAEAQAREANIEAAPERVRAKAMAIHKSDKFDSAVATVFEELDKLDLGMQRCGIGILNKEKRSSDVWTTSRSEQGHTIHVSGDESIDIHPMLQGAFDAWLRQGDFSYILQGEDLAIYCRAMTGARPPQLQLAAIFIVRRFMDFECRALPFSSPFRGQVLTPGMGCLRFYRTL
jgi:hypothetical protein